MFESIVDPIFAPLLNLGPLLAMLIISFVVSLVIVIVYKFMTKQGEMKDLKAEIKNLQNEMKTLKDNPTKMMEVQKKVMSKNLEYMKHSFKPTLITFLPLILIFGWLNVTMAYEPIIPNEEFIVSVYSGENVTINAPEKITLLDTKNENGKIDFKLKGQEGEYLLEFNIDDEIQTKDVMITDKQKYAVPVKELKNSKITKIEIKYNKLKVLNLFGWELGWLGTYIIFSLVFSIVLRKLMKVH